VIPEVGISKSIQFCGNVAEVTTATSWWRGPAVEHRSLADVLSLSCARLVADG